MMKIKVLISLFVALAVAVLIYCLPRNYSSSKEVLFAGGDTMADSLIRINNACLYVNKDKTHEDMVRRYLKDNASSSSDAEGLLRALRNIKVSVVASEEVKAIITVESQSIISANIATELYAEALVKYFEDEWSGLCKKINGWFDLQIIHKQKRNESVESLKAAKDAALFEASRRSLRARIVGKP